MQQLVLSITIEFSSCNRFFKFLFGFLHCHSYSSAPSSNNKV